MSNFPSTASIEAHGLNTGLHRPAVFVKKELVWRCLSGGLQNMAILVNYTCKSFTKLTPGFRLCH